MLGIFYGLMIFIILSSPNSDGNEIFIWFMLLIVGGYLFIDKDEN